MARPALEIKEDDALGPAEAGTMRALALGGVRGRRLLALEPEDVGQRQAEDGRAADTEQFAPRHPIASDRFSGPLRNDQHDRASRASFGGLPETNAGGYLAVLKMIIAMARRAGQTINERFRRQRGR